MTSARLPTHQQMDIIPPAQYKPRDQVWLEVTHLKLPHQGFKLNPKQYGPFKILSAISPVAFKLELPVSWTIHLVFHASLLTPYIKTHAHGPNYSCPPPDLINDEEQYEVEQIRNHWHHRHSRTLQYLIKWWGYPESDNTLEPADQVYVTWWTIGMLMLTNIFTIYIYFSHTPAGVITTSFTLSYLLSNPLQPCPIVCTLLQIIIKVLTLICQWFLWPYCHWNASPLPEHSLIVALV